MKSKIEMYSEYEKIVNECNVPLVVVIIAEWCGTCQIMAPIIDRLADKYNDKIKFIMADLDSSEKLAKNFEPETLPILLFFNRGIPVDRLSGTISYSVLEMKIEKLLEFTSNNNSLKS